MRMAAKGTATQNATPAGGLDGRSRAGPPWWLPHVSHGRGEHVPVRGRVRVSRGGPRRHAPVGRPDAGGLVADPDEGPHEEESGVQWTVGLSRPR